VSRPCCSSSACPATRSAASSPSSSSCGRCCAGWPATATSPVARSSAPRLTEPVTQVAPAGGPSCACAWRAATARTGGGWRTGRRPGLACTVGAGGRRRPGHRSRGSRHLPAGAEVDVIRLRMEGPVDTATARAATADPRRPRRPAADGRRQRQAGDRAPGVAEAVVTLEPETLSAIIDGTVAKGDVLTVAEMAGVMGGKRTAELIPLCHPIPLTDLAVEITPERAAGGLRIRATAATIAPTGVEMEALTAACRRRAHRLRYGQGRRSERRHHRTSAAREVGRPLGRVAARERARPAAPRGRAGPRTRELSGKTRETEGAAHPFVLSCSRSAMASPPARATTRAVSRWPSG
jgi:molybdenum cofactor biosynthesis protein MoaC